MKRILLTSALLALLISATSCEPDTTLTETTVTPLVVEGWIEDGAAPMVIVTHAVDLTQGTPSFDGFVEKWARVSVFDGDTQYLLTGRINNDYTPSFIFTSSRLKGKPGHTYRLLVETEERTLEATATLPDAPAIASLEAVPLPDNPDLYSIQAYVANPEDNRYYKFFTKTNGTDPHFYGSFLGTFAGKEYSPTEGYTITRGIHGGYNSDEFSHYFTHGEQVTVKLCTLESHIYDFWKIYDSNVSLSSNLFFTFSHNCPSNIEGGLGYWAAYGSAFRTIRIP